MAYFGNNKTFKTIGSTHPKFIPHAVCSSTKFLANARETGIKVLNQSGLYHFIRERQLQSPRHGDDVQMWRCGVQFRLKLDPSFTRPTTFRSLMEKVEYEMFYRRVWFPLLTSENTATPVFNRWPQNDQISSLYACQ